MPEVGASCAGIVGRYGAAVIRTKATEIGTALYLKAPPKAQTAILTGIGKAEPVVAAVKPHATKLLGAGAGLLALRRFRHRG